MTPDNPIDDSTSTNKRHFARGKQPSLGASVHILDAPEASDYRGSLANVTIAGLAIDSLRPVPSGSRVVISAVGQPALRFLLPVHDRRIDNGFDRRRSQYDQDSGRLAENLIVQ
jgi:hypothetical protein